VSTTESGAPPRSQWRVSAARVGERLLRTFGRRRPLPAVKLGLRSAIGAWVLRLAQVAIAVGCAAIVAGVPVQWAIGILLTLGMIVRPAPAWSAVFVVWIGISVVMAPGDPLGPRTFVLLFGTHLLVALSAVLDRIPLGARVEPTVLVRPARRFLVVQAICQPLALAAAWLAVGRVSAVGVAVVAILALAAAMWFLSLRLLRMTRRESDDDWR
jgi:hypothetical protein